MILESVYMNFGIFNESPYIVIIPLFRALVNPENNFFYETLEIIFTF